MPGMWQGEALPILDPEKVLDIPLQPPYNGTWTSYLQSQSGMFNNSGQERENQQKISHTLTGSFRTVSSLQEVQFLKTT